MDKDGPPPPLPQVSHQSLPPPPPPPVYPGPPPPVPALSLSTTTTYSVMTMQPAGVSITPAGIPVPPGNLVKYDVTPVRIICQYCQAEVITRTTSKVGALTFLACGGMVFVGCFLGCCLIPFFMDSLKDTVHTCPHCKRQVGVHRHI